MSLALINGSILIDKKIIKKHCVLIKDSKILSVIPQKDLSHYPSYKTYDLKNLLLAPGFIDIQVNGGGGVLFNDNPCVETITQIGKAHRQFGTTGFLPTLISDDLEKIAQAIKAVNEAISQNVQGVLGIHIEGPFLSKDKKGIHDPSKFRILQKENIALLTSLTKGKTLITLAPECANDQLITQLTKAGAIISIGHTNATYQQTRDAITHGATGFTHLFNAMSAFTSRAPGVVGAALEDQNTWCGIIVDGKHIAPTSLKIALRCKPTDKFILITDAMPSVGSHETSFMLQGKKIKVIDNVCMSEDGTLAGCHLNMVQAFKNCLSMLDVPVANAFHMASLNAAKFLNLQHLGKIAPDYWANLIALDKDFNIKQSWIKGQMNHEHIKA